MNYRKQKKVLTKKLKIAKAHLDKHFLSNSARASVVHLMWDLLDLKKAKKK